VYFPYGIPNECCMTYHPMLELVCDNSATFLRLRCSLSHHQVASDFNGNFGGSGWPVKGNGYVIIMALKHVHCQLRHKMCGLSSPEKGVVEVMCTNCAPEGQLACGHTVVSGPCQIYARSRQFVDLLVYQTRSWNDASIYTGCAKNEFSLSLFFFVFCKLECMETWFILSLLM
jgi:hypothetical protein